MSRALVHVTKSSSILLTRSRRQASHSFHHCRSVSVSSIDIDVITNRASPFRLSSRHLYSVKIERRERKFDFLLTKRQSNKEIFAEIKPFLLECVENSQRARWRFSPWFSAISELIADGSKYFDRWESEKKVVRLFYGSEEKTMICQRLAEMFSGLSFRLRIKINKKVVRVFCEILFKDEAFLVSIQNLRISF